MDKKTAKGLMPLVNDIEKMEALQAYVDERIETMRGYLEVTRDHQKILEMQGAIAELRRIQTLRDQAIEGAK